VGLRAKLILTAALLNPAFAQDAASLYRQGVDRQRRGDLAGAAELYRKSLDLDGTNVAARSNRGAALAGLGRYDEAVLEYQQALKNAPAQVIPMLQRNLALAWYKSGRMEEAAPLLMALHDARPDNRETTLLAGDCLLQLGEPLKALALLEPLAADAAQDRALAYVLGTAYLKAGRTAEAQRILDPLLKDETSPEGRYALGVAMFTSGDYPSAVKALERAIQLDPKLPRVQSFYGQALIFTGDPDAALAAFAKQLATDPNDYDANYQSGLIFARRNKPVEAEARLRRAVTLRTKSAGARLALGEALMANAKWPEARTELERTVREWPEFGAAHSKLAEIYSKAGLKADAAQERALGAKYAVKVAQQPGLQNGVPAPRMRLGDVEITAPRIGKATVLVFGSYSCPNFRKAAPALNELSQTLAKQVSFLQVYIREAHSTEQWQSTVNEREGVQLAPASSAGQKQEYAIMCQRKLHLRFPSVVDTLDDAAQKAYQAWPSRVYVLTADGHVQYSSGLTEEDFDRKALESAIRSVLPRETRREVQGRTELRQGILK
jgi:tetratricopeptide (TPR) repeat protein